VLLPRASQIGGGTTLPVSGCAFISVKDEDKPFIVDAARTLLAEGFTLMATGGTHSYLVEQGLAVTHVKKVLEGRPHIVDAMKNGEVQLVFNTTSGKQSLQDSFSLRRTALMMKIPYYTTTAGSQAAAQAIGAIKAGDLDVRPIQDYGVTVSADLLIGVGLLYLGRDQRRDLAGVRDGQGGGAAGA
jgi:carbamoyl-phosphate synthase large subunit